MERFVEVTGYGQGVSVQNGWLVVKKWRGEEVGRVPLDDLSSLMLADKGLTVSAVALAELAQRGIPLIVCDKRHLPIGIMQSLDVYHKQAGVLAKQIAAGVVVKKQLWQALVQAKIKNQAQILKWRKLEYKDVEKMSLSVRSGDVTNLEGIVARIYWDRLSVFDVRCRFAEDANRLFNYAYAIVFAMVARAICQSGLHPSIGIHHHRQNNSFCLASDVMEPYRAVADAAVLKWIDAHKEDTEVTSEAKKFLISEIMEAKVLMGDRRESFPIALQRTLVTLRDSLFSNVIQLEVPSFDFTEET